MIWLLLLSLVGTVVTGWLTTWDAFWGEEWVEELHGLLANILIALAGLHALAAIVMSHREQSGLVRAMFTGRKRLPTDSTNH